MLLAINFVLLLVTAVFASPPVSDLDEKGLKSDADDKVLNSIDDSLDDRPKRSYESGGYQWGSPNQADPFNTAYSPPNNFYGFGRGGGNEFPGGPTNPFQQSPFDRGQPGNNGKNPLQEVMGRALESVIVQSVRQLLDMTPLGGGQGGSMRSARNARSVENIEKTTDHKMEKREKVNFIEKLGSTGVKDTHSLEKRDARSGEDDSVGNSEIQLIMKEVKRQRRMRQMAQQQQKLIKNRETVDSQKMINQQNNSEGNWQQNMNNAQKLEYLSKYQKDLMDLYREKQNRARIINKDGGKIRDSKLSTKYSTPQQDRTMVGDYPMNRQQEFSNYDGRRNVQQPRSSKYLQADNNNSRFSSGKQGFEPEQGFMKQNVGEPQNFMMNKMGQSADWSQQNWDQNNRFVQQQQGMRKDNSIQKWNDKSVIQQNQQFRSEKVSNQVNQEAWRPGMQQPPQHQQFFNVQPDFSQNNMLPQQIPKTSNAISGKQRYQRTSTNEICKDGFTPSGVPCSMDTAQKQMSDGSFENSPNNQEMLLQPPTLIKRYVTYSNRFVPPPEAVMEPVSEQELLTGEGKSQNNFERTNSMRRRFSDEGNLSSQEQREMQRSQGDEGMMNGWVGQ